MLDHTHAALLASAVLHGCGTVRDLPRRPAAEAAATAGDEARGPAEPDHGERMERAEAATPTERSLVPEPQVMDDAHVRVAGRLLEVSIDESDTSGALLVVAIDGAAAGDQRLSLPTRLQTEHCDLVQAFVEPVPGAASPLALARACCFFHKGTDDMERCRVALIHVGDDTTSPRVLWQGDSHHDDLDGCTDIGLPRVELVLPGTVVVEQVEMVARHGSPEDRDPRCDREMPSTRRLAEITF